MQTWSTAGPVELIATQSEVVSIVERFFFSKEFVCIRSCVYSLGMCYVVHKASLCLSLKSNQTVNDTKRIYTYISDKTKIHVCIDN